MDLHEIDALYCWYCTLPAVIVIVAAWALSEVIREEYQRDHPVFDPGWKGTGFLPYHPPPPPPPPLTVLTGEPLLWRAFSRSRVHLLAALLVGIAVWVVVRLALFLLSFVYVPGPLIGAIFIYALYLPAVIALVPVLAAITSLLGGEAFARRMKVRHLLKQIRSADIKVRDAAAEALGLTRDPRAVPALLRLIDSPDGGARGAAIRALGEIGDKRAEPALLRALEDDSRGVREMAVWALIRGNEKPDPRIVVLQSIKNNLTWHPDAVLAHGLQAVEPLIWLLNADLGDLELVNAVDTLGKLKDSRALEPLVGVTQNNYGGIKSHLDTIRFDNDVGFRVGRALNAIDGKKAAELLLVALKRPYSKKHSVMEKALEQLDRTVLTQVLLPRIAECKEYVYCASSYLLSDMDVARVEQVLAPALTADSAAIREAAESVLRDVRVMADNLRRWRESGAPSRWVAEHNGQWNHNEWQRLLDELSRSPYWPMQPNAVGAVLEESKRSR